MIVSFDFVDDNGKHLQHIASSNFDVIPRVGDLVTIDDAYVVHSVLWDLNDAPYISVGLVPWGH